MTLRDYRLKAAARTWGRAQLQPAGTKDRSDWLAKQTTHVNRRAKKARHQHQGAKKR